MSSNDEDTRLVVEESHQLDGPSAETRRRLDRLDRQARRLTLPPGLKSPNEVRDFCRDAADRAANAAENDQERQSAADWRHRIEAATDTELWDDYHRPLTRQPRRPNGSPSRMMSIRVPTNVHEAASKEAFHNGETLSAVVVRMLREYGRCGALDMPARGND